MQARGSGFVAFKRAASVLSEPHHGSMERSWSHIGTKVIHIGYGVASEYLEVGKEISRVDLSTIIRHRKEAASGSPPTEETKMSITFC